jgi:hypothetical protein
MVLRFPVLVVSPITDKAFVKAGKLARPQQR